MDPASLVKLAAIASIFCIVVSIGLRARPEDTLALLRHPALAARAMLAMFVLVPAFAITIIFALPLTQPVRAALFALAVSPMPPILPKKEEKVGGDGDYIIGLQVLATLVSIVAAPFFVWLGGRVSGQATLFAAAPLLKTLALTVGFPLLLGILGNRLVPERAQRLAGPLGKAGMAMLALAGGLILFGSWHFVVAALGNGTLVAVIAIAVLALASGHLLGGPDEGNRGALAVASAARHPGVAIGLATMSFPQHAQAIIGAVLLAVIASIIVGLPYVQWRRRVAAAG